MNNVLLLFITILIFYLKKIYIYFFSFKFDFGL